VRCVWLDTPLAEAQVNVVLRMLERHGELLGGEALVRASKRDPGVFAPTAQHRFLRQFEPPAEDEGWRAIERRPFVRPPYGGRPGRAVALDLVPSIPPAAEPTLAFAWSPPHAPVDPTFVAAAAAAGMEVAVCAHPDGPPSCWCRPPLPGLVVRWLRDRRIDPKRSVLIGRSRALRTLAETLGMTYDAR
jgi:hypothetical protein